MLCVECSFAYRGQEGLASLHHSEASREMQAFNWKDVVEEVSDPCEYFLQDTWIAKPFKKKS